MSRGATMTMVRILCVAGFALALGACEGAKEKLGLTKQAPDEFRVHARAPLSVPPDFNLRPPRPGEARPQEGTARQQAQRVVFGLGKSYGINGAARPNRRSPGEEALLRRAGAGQAEPNIRQIVDRESGHINEEDQTFLDRLVFWRDAEATGEVIDADAEAKRLQENAALGRPATAGETPTIERSNKTLFETLF